MSQQTPVQASGAPQTFPAPAPAPVPSAATPVAAGTTPFYLNQIWWGTRIVQLLALLVAFNVIHITSAQLQLITGFITTALADTALSAHSAYVATHGS